MRVSVVVPCYNAEPYLAQAIGSALDQTRPPHEVIIIDDGSTDGSVALARRFERAAPDRVRVRAERSGRASRTRNLGALLAAGDALLFLDADDVLGPDALEALSGALARQPDGVAVCPWFRLELNVGRWTKQPPSCRPRLAGEDPLSAWLTGWYHPPCAVLWSRPAFEHAGRWDELATVNDDGDLMMRALARGIPLVEGTAGAAYYRRRADGAPSLSGTRLTREAIASRLRIVRKIAYVLETRDQLDRYRAPLRHALGLIAGDVSGRDQDLRRECTDLARWLAPSAWRRAGRRVAALARLPRRVAARVRGRRPSSGQKPGPERTPASEEITFGLACAERLLRSAPVDPSADSAAPPPPERPAVSVIIPAYNRARLLRRALDSVRSQVFADFEVLVVDDASTDETHAVVTGDPDPRVRYFRQPRNSGVAAARNRGLREARGELIAFLDSDDEWFPDKLARQVERFRAAPETMGLAYTGVESVRQDGTRHYACSSDRGDIYRELLWRNAIHGGGSNVMIRRAVIAAAGFFHEGLPAIEDYEFWVRIARFFEADVIEAPLIRYHDPHWAGRRSLAAAANLNARWWFYRTHAAEMRRAGVAHLFLLNTARWILLSPDPDVRGARRLAVQALREKPMSRMGVAMLMRTLLRRAGQVGWVQRHAALE